MTSRLRAGVDSVLGDAPPVDRREMVGVPHLWTVKRRFQVEFLRDRGLEPDHRLLDVGCGTLRSLGQESGLERDDRQRMLAFRPDSGV